MPSPIVAYSLLTFSFAGVVGHADGFPDRRLCEEAKSIAMHHVGVDDWNASQAADKAKGAIASDAFVKAHPPRKPQDGLERAFLNSRKTESLGLSPNLRRVDADTVQELPPTDATVAIHEPTDAKFASCVAQESPQVAR